MRELVQVNRPVALEAARMSVQTVPSLVHLPVKKKPLTFSDYQLGWRLYKAVYLEKFRQDVQAMLTYENDIFSFANNGLDWLTYDETF